MGIASKVQDLQKRQLTARDLVVILHHITVVTIPVGLFSGWNESQNFLQHGKKKNAAGYNQTVDGQGLWVH